MGRREHHHRRSGRPADLAEAESREGSGHRGISFEQDRALMRILKLTAQTEAKLMRLRQGDDRVALQAAAKIVADVRLRGDAALDKWNRKFDPAASPRASLWISPAETAAAKHRVSRGFLR